MVAYEEKENNMSEVRKFSIRTTDEEAELIRLAYSSFRNKVVICQPEKSPPSMNQYLRRLIIDRIMRDEDDVITD